MSLCSFALPEQADHRDARAFLVDLGAARHAARRDAADVGMMRDVAHEADELAVGEHRHRHVDVGQMRAAGRVAGRWR